MKDAKVLTKKENCYEVGLMDNAATDIIRALDLLRFRTEPAITPEVEDARSACRDALDTIMHLIWRRGSRAHSLEEFKDEYLNIKTYGETGD